MRQVVHTDKAPAALGPYSQAVKNSSGSFVFCSGQIALKPGTDEIMGDKAAEQCHQVMKNLSEVLKEAGATLDDVVKTTIYLTDMNDFTDVNEVYGSYFSSEPPARATVEVSRLPKDVRVEVDAIAVISSQ